jgi:hypothetical protein
VVLRHGVKDLRHGEEWGCGNNHSKS